MESNESRLARLETKVDYITKQIDKLVNTLECKDKDCKDCKREIEDKIKVVEDKTNKLTIKLVGIIAAISAGGGTLGTILSKVLGLI